MEISHVEMDHISDQRTNITQIDGFAPRRNNANAPGTQNHDQDSFEMDSVRQHLRDLCETGQAENHIDEIIDSGIQPDCLRAELAFRAFQGDAAAVTIVISYLAGNFKEAFDKTERLSEEDAQKMKEMLIFADYFAGRLDKGCEEVKNFPTLNFSPFLCYAYADMLLSLGFIEDARLFRKKYVLLARRYLKNFVSEKEKYEDEKKRREQGMRRGKQNEKNENGRNDPDGKNEESQQDAKNTLHSADSAQSPALYAALKVLLERRRVLLYTLKARNVSIDKCPLLFELEDIDARIAQTTGKGEKITQY